ncbi:MAG TPA: hypothetical protein VLJ14_18240, partial [Ktedonobacterales bacterium]|nr:hypothetical protein [Ktedonobacterales bacterium]
AAAHEGASGRRDTGSHQPPALCARVAPYYPRSTPSLCSVVALSVSHTLVEMQAARGAAGVRTRTWMVRGRNVWPERRTGIRYGRVPPPAASDRA